MFYIYIYIEREREREREIEYYIYIYVFYVCLYVPLCTTVGVLLRTLWRLFSRRFFDASLKGFWATGVPKGNEKGALGEGWMCAWTTNSSVS